jgi:hypothetical protein
MAGKVDLPGLWAAAVLYFPHETGFDRRRSHCGKYSEVRLAMPGTNWISGRPLVKV